MLDFISVARWGPVAVQRKYPKAVGGQPRLTHDMPTVADLAMIILI